MFTVKFNHLIAKDIVAKTPGSAVHKAFRQWRKSAIKAGLDSKYWPTKPKYDVDTGGWVDVVVDYIPLES